MPFKVGDIVRLKSGGPKMTITEPPDAATVGWHCAWFDERNEYCTHCFETDTLALCGADPHLPPVTPGPHLDTLA